MSPTQDKAGALRPIGKAATLWLDALVPSPSNREGRKDEDLKGLDSSIRTVGLIYPLVVKPDAEQEGIYRIIAGERRWRAMKMLKLESAPCLVLSAKEDEANAEVLRVVENHQRRNLEPLEEAAAVRGLLDLGLEPQAVGVDLEEAFQTPVLHAADVATSRKSDGNAVPALVVNGPGLGRVKWVQPVHDEPAPRSSRRTSRGGDSATRYTFSPPFTPIIARLFAALDPCAPQPGGMSHAT